MKVMVTDANDKKSLAAVRFLAREGVEVHAAGPKRWDASLFSKHSSGSIVYPNPARDPQGFVEFMLDYLRRNRFDCVLPMSDYTTIAFSKHKNSFEEFTALPVADYEVLEVARDKPRMTEIAAALTIPTPETICPSTIEEVEALAGGLDYPVVVKYKRGTGAIGCRYAHSAGELLAHYRTQVHAQDIVFDDTFPMIQEYIPGPTRDTSVLFHNGECRAALNTWRVRTYPPDGGWGVVNETYYDETLTDYAVRLCEEIGYHGPAQVEFKEDLRTGQLKFIEVNTRFWGGTGVACEAGINFPHMAARMAVEGDVEPCFEYERGMLYRWPFPQELRSVFADSNRFERMLEYLTVKRGTRFDIWPSDPLPHLVPAALAVYRFARRKLPKVARRKAGPDK